MLCCGVPCSLSPKICVTGCLKFWFTPSDQFHFVYYQLPGTVKPNIFTWPIFHEFRNLSKFAKITGRTYSNSNQLLSAFPIDHITVAEIQVPK